MHKFNRVLEIKLAGQETMIPVSVQQFIRVMRNPNLRVVRVRMLAKEFSFGELGLIDIANEIR